MTCVETAATAGLSRGAKKILVGTALAVLALRLAIVDTPTLRDEGLYGYIAQEVLRGYLPMETALDNKGPVLFYVEALALALFGLSSIEGIRVFGMLFILGTGWLLFALGRDMRNERFGLIAMGLFAFHTSLVKLDGHYYASEFFSLWPGMLSAWLGWRAVRSPSLWLAFYSGLAVGLAIWTRLTMVTWAAFLGGYLLWACQRQQKLPRTTAFTGAIALVSVAFLGLYAWHGQLKILADAYLTSSSVQTATSDMFISESAQLWKILGITYPQTMLLWLPVAAVFFGNQMERETKWFLYSWLLMAAVGFWVTHLYLLKQTFLLYPPLCLLAAWQLEAWSRSPERVKVLALLVGANLVFNICWSGPKYLGLYRGDPAVNSPIITEGEKVAQWIKANTKPGDYIYNWGVEWEIYFRSERRSPTRYVNVLIFVMFAVAVENGSGQDKAFEDLQKTVIADLEAHRPEIIAVTAGVKTYDLNCFTLPTYFDKMLRTEYDLLFEQKPYWIFRRKSPQPTHQPQSGGL